MNPKTYRNRLGLQLALTCLISLCASINVYSAPGTLADVPLYLGDSVSPNVLWVVDDSGSMDWEVLTRRADNPYSYGNRDNVDITPDNQEKRVEVCVGYNVLAYDPSLTYVPWVRPDGTSYPDQDNISNVMRDPLKIGRNNLNNNDFINLTNAKYLVWNDADADGTFDRGECGEGNASSRVTVQVNERTNYANWYTYYRKRSYVMKAILTGVFNDSEYRFGLATINNDDDIGTKIGDMTIGANKSTLTQRLIDVATSGGTPLKRSLNNAGRYFDKTETPQNNFIDNNPEGYAGNSTTPIVNSCQANYTIMVTDGFANENNTNYVGNVDQGQGDPYGDNVSNTMADVAMKYYLADLDDDATNNNFRSKNPRDLSTQQHMVTHALAFGVQGSIDTTPVGENKVPRPVAENWVWNANSEWLRDIDNNSMDTIDDLYHATVNSRGQFFSSSDPTQLKKDVQEVMNTIAAETAGTGAAVGVNTTSLSTDTLLFQAWFSSDEWAGELRALSFGSSGAIASSSSSSSSSNASSSSGGVAPVVPLPGGLVEEDTNAFCGIDGAVDSNPDRDWTGDGYANTDNNAGNGVDWAIYVEQSGEYTIRYRYAYQGGGGREGFLAVNGAAATPESEFDFNNTGGWNNWNTEEITVTLNAGNNLLRLEATDGAGLPNIDTMTISGGEVSVGDCNGPPGLSSSSSSNSSTGGSSSSSSSSSSSGAASAPSLDFDNLVEVWEAGDVLGRRDLDASPRVLLTYSSSESIDGSGTGGTGRGVVFKAPVTDTSGTGGVTRELNDTHLADLMSHSHVVSATDKPAALAELIDWFYGDISKEGRETNDPFFFRKRPSLLGDIISSSPQYVGVPLERYPNEIEGSSESEKYLNFVLSNDTDAEREPMVYVGSNDGMLHGFRASDGEEVFAYLPEILFTTEAGRGYHELAEKTYEHAPYVNGTPTIKDVYVDGGWKTYLLGTLNGGGKGVFVLDVTNPEATVFPGGGTVPAEADLADIVVTEFTHENLGYTYARAQIGKLNNGRWAAIFGNGYNNDGSGQASLFILYLDDANNDGEFDFFEIPTGAGSVVAAGCSSILSDCNGLSSPSILDLTGDGIIDRVYAGDVHGNMWAFDLSLDASTNEDQNAWLTKKYLLHRACSVDLVRGVCPAADRQPITSKPVIVGHQTEVAKATAPNLMVMFGTGQYLTSADTDPANSGTQSFYGIWDAGPDYDDVDRGTLVEQVVTTETDPLDGSVLYRTIDASPVDYGVSDDRGWYMDLPQTGERSVLTPIVNGSIVSFVTSVPEVQACQGAGGSAWLMAVDIFSGDQAPNKLFGDVDASVAGIPLDNLSGGIVSRENQYINVDSTGKIELIGFEYPDKRPARRASWSIIR